LAKILLSEVRTFFNDQSESAKDILRYRDFITVLRRLNPEHLGFKSTVFRLQAQSADPGT
jgi:hypothetical protein